MRHLITVLLTILTALGLSTARASDWPQDAHDAAATSYIAGAIGPAQAARLHVAWARHGFVAVDVVAAGGYVYTLAVNGGRYSILVQGAAGGRTLRIYTAQSLHLPRSNGQLSNQPQDLAYAGGRLIIAAVGTVLAINPLTGHQYWRVPGGAQQLTVAGGVVYTGKGCQSACGALASYAINLWNGKVLWEHRGNFGAVPTLAMGHLFQPWGEMTGETRIYARDGSLTGTLPFMGLWSGDTAHAYVMEMGVSAMSRNSHATLTSVTADGHIAWSVNLGRANEIHPVIAGGRIFVPSYRFHPGMVAVNARNGRLLWASDVGAGLQIIAAGRLVYTYAQQRCLTILDAATGRTLRTLQPAGCRSRPGSLIFAGNTLYIANGNGLTAYRP